MRGPNTSLTPPVASDKKTYAEALKYVDTLNASGYGGYSDWRLPSIKELYSLIRFDGTDPSSCTGSTCEVIPFIDTAYFNFAYGQASAGERIIDSQYLTKTKFVGSADKYFGVNFADGRIKGYDSQMPNGTTKTFFVQLVRGNDRYGINYFVDNGDQTITDTATGLMWSKMDSGKALNWQDTLAWVKKQNEANYLGHSDWRLPNAKELESIVDYSRSPETSNSAAIDTLFSASQITNEAGRVDYPFYWTSTTHASSHSGGNAVYVSFGRALGYMNGSWIDIHGAGAQRSDPKNGDPSMYPTGHGPQGDAIRIYNYARLVRGGGAVYTPSGDTSAARPAVTVETGGSSVGQGGVSANNQQNIGQAPQRGLPPQEAVSACSGKTNNTSCSFYSPMGMISGTCRFVSNQLACVP